MAVDPLGGGLVYRPGPGRGPEPDHVPGDCDAPDAPAQNDGPVVAGEGPPEGPPFPAGRPPPGDGAGAPDPQRHEGEGQGRQPHQQGGDDDVHGNLQWADPKAHPEHRVPIHAYRT